MNKQELIGSLAQRAGLGRTETARVLDVMIDIIVEALADDVEVRIVGFGSFAMAPRKASVGRNPRTGETIAIAESRHVRFRPGKRLKALG